MVIKYEITASDTDAQIDSPQYPSFPEGRCHRNLQDHNSNFLSHHIPSGDFPSHYRVEVELFQEGYEVGRRRCLPNRKGQDVKLLSEGGIGEGYVSPKGLSIWVRDTICR